MMAHVGERGACRVLVGWPEGRKPFGRHRHRWEDNIKMDLQALRLGVVDWSSLGQGQIVGSCEHGNDPLDFIKCK
jgi:hypothetical protein